MTKPTVAAWKKSVRQFTDQPIPAGFERTIRREKWGYSDSKEPDTTIFTFKNQDGVELIVTVGDDPSDWNFGSGTTNFSTKLGQRTFDRRGVDQSFYLDKPEDFARIVEEQLKRVAESRARIAISEPVPGLPGGHTVTPERKELVSKTLKSGKSYAFTPAGFGTGYNLSTRRGRYSEKAAAETAQFFGVRELFYDRMDCD